jgi:hypothetical protein
MRKCWWGNDLLDFRPQANPTLFRGGSEEGARGAWRGMGRRIRMFRMMGTRRVRGGLVNQDSRRPNTSYITLASREHST